MNKTSLIFLFCIFIINNIYSQREINYDKGIVNFSLAEKKIKNWNIGFLR